MISNEFTSPKDQDLPNLKEQNIPLTTTTVPASCATGDINATNVNINDAVSNLDNQWNKNVVSQVEAVPLNGNINVTTAQKIIDTASAARAPISTLDTTLLGDGTGNYYRGTADGLPDDYIIPSSTYLNNLNYPRFGDDDPLLDPNRPYSVNDTSCNAALWALLTLPCPTCNGGKKLGAKNRAGKKYINLSSLFSRCPASIRIPVGDIEDLINSVIQFVDVRQLFDKKKCPTCDNKGTVKDVTGVANQKAKEVAQKLDSKKEQIQKLEQKAGGSSGCGNRIAIINGYDVLEVGLGMNKTKSYAQGKSEMAPGSVRIGGGVQFVETTVTVGKNVTATPGGAYTIKCSNKFTCFTGAQGIELITYGPVNIAGGITKITGPEVTIGSSTGTCTVEGNHLQLTGKTIGIGPVEGDNQIVVQGTLGVSSNLVVNGSAHVNGDLSFTSATVPSTTKRAHFGSQSDVVTGGASWGGIAVKAISDVMQNMIADISHMVIDPSTPIISRRGIEKVMEHVLTLAKVSRPWELLPTGYILTGTPISLALLGGTLTGFAGPSNIAGPVAGVGAFVGGELLGIVETPIPLNNFPHVHALPDMFHTHDMEVPNIKLLPSSEGVVGTARQKESALPSGAVNENDLLEVLKLIGHGAITEAKKLLYKIMHIA
jgi:hypothetical protein